MIKYISWKLHVKLKYNLTSWAQLCYLVSESLDGLNIIGLKYCQFKIVCNYTKFNVELVYWFHVNTVCAMFFLETM